MALIALSTDVTKNYSLNSDTAEEKTIFLLSGIDSITRAYIDDEHSGRDWETIAVHDKYINFVRFGLKGWTCFKNAEGIDVEFKTEEKVFPRIGKRVVATDETLKHLQLTWIVELGIEIVSNSTLSAEDKKK